MTVHESNCIETSVVQEPSKAPQQINTKATHLSTTSATKLPLVTGIVPLIFLDPPLCITFM